MENKVTYLLITIWIVGLVFAVMCMYSSDPMMALWGLTIPYLITSEIDRRNHK